MEQEDRDLLDLHLGHFRTPDQCIQLGRTLFQKAPLLLSDLRALISELEGAKASNRMRAARKFLLDRIVGAVEGAEDHGLPTKMTSFVALLDLASIVVVRERRSDGMTWSAVRMTGFDPLNNSSTIHMERLRRRVKRALPADFISSVQVMGDDKEPSGIFFRVAMVAETRSKIDDDRKLNGTRPTFLAYYPERDCFFASQTKPDRVICKALSFSLSFKSDYELVGLNGQLDALAQDLFQGDHQAEIFQQPVDFGDGEEEEVIPQNEFVGLNGQLDPLAQDSFQDDHHDEISQGPVEIGDDFQEEEELNSQNELEDWKPEDVSPSPVEPEDIGNDEHYPLQEEEAQEREVLFVNHPLQIKKKDRPEQRMKKCSFQDCKYKTNSSTNLMQHINSFHVNSFLVNSSRVKSFRVKSFRVKSSHVNSFQVNQHRHVFERYDYGSQQGKNANLHFDNVRLERKTVKQIVRGGKGRKVVECSNEGCEFKTVNVQSLARHVRAIHLEKKRFVCEQCDYRSAYEFVLRRHVRGVHQKVRSFKCDRCDYCTSYQFALKRHHVYRHSEENNG